MYKVKDYIIYKRDVCTIKEINKKYYKNTDYYTVSPIADESLTIRIPADSSAIKNIISKEEALKIIEQIPEIKCIDSDEKTLENIYKELLNTDDLIDLVKIIKTTYLRNKKRLDSGKKIGDKDNLYFEKSEKYLYTQLSIALNMTYDECKKTIIEKLSGA